MLGQRAESRLDCGTKLLLDFLVLSKISILSCSISHTAQSSKVHILLCSTHKYCMILKASEHETV